VPWCLRRAYQDPEDWEWLEPPLPEYTELPELSGVAALGVAVAVGVELALELDVALGVDAFAVLATVPAAALWASMVP
jgi:hypothetical protein